MKQTVEVDRPLALMGAEARVRQIRAEMQELYRKFPELRRQRSLGETPDRAPGGTRKKRVFSAKGKRAISEGMVKYWARRKAQAAKGAKGARAS